MKVEPLPKNPTNADLARQGDELHACLHNVDEKLDAHIAKTAENFEVSQKSRHEVRNSVMNLEGSVAKLERHVLSFTDDLGKAHNEFLTVAGQLRAISDDKVVVDGSFAARLDQMRAAQLSIAERLGATADPHGPAPKSKSFASLSRSQAAMIFIGAVGASQGVFAILNGLLGSWPKIVAAFAAFVQHGAH